MEKLRKPFQGVWNIIRFNWHFYVLSVGFGLLLLAIANYLNEPFRTCSYIFLVAVGMTMVITLIASYYIYDIAGLYKLNWIDDVKTKGRIKIVNIHAGFDETSGLLNEKFKQTELVVLDFYDPLKHTEVSIKRARKAYPPFPGTQQVKTTDLPVEDDSADRVFVILSAHEIRNEEERLTFFKELNRIIKPGGQIYITEHLRDVVNFLAYNIGFFHFHSRASWLKTFQGAKLKIEKEIKLTPFISTFILGKNGNSF